jgi:regulator of RNase E activity RraA
MIATFASSTITLLFSVTQLMSGEPDARLVERLTKLYTAVVADVLDSLGYRRQTLAAALRPLTPVRQVCGRVFTAQATTVDSVPAKPYELEIAAVDAMQAGDVLVVDVGNDSTCGFWGELLTTACLAKGVRGVVMSACTRDLWKIRDLDFPVFGLGYHPADSLGRADIIKLGTPIKIGGVETSPGDLILGDDDGIVIVPRAAADEALRRADEKVAGENMVRKELERGVPIGEVFKKYGIL